MPSSRSGLSEFPRYSTSRTIMKAIFFIFLAFCAVSCNCTRVYQCGSKIATVNGVTISGCDEAMCILKKTTTVTIEQEFTLDHDVEDVITVVHAIIHGVPLPFIGVDGTDACSNFYQKGGTEKVPCPLKKDNTYVYKNQFEILPSYPNFRLIVHWALEDKQKKQDITCFEVPAKISR